MSELFIILISTGLVSNLVLDYMLGTDPLLATSRKIEPAVSLTLLMLIVMPPSAMLAWLVKFHVLLPLDLMYLELIGLVMIIAIVVTAVDKLTALYRPDLHQRISLFIPLLMVNCTVLGVALLNSRVDYGPFTSLFSGLGSAAGFGLVLLAFSAIRGRVSVADVPAPFRGTAILMITLGMISMAFMGFNGISSLK